MSKKGRDSGNLRKITESLILKKPEKKEKKNIRTADQKKPPRRLICKIWDKTAVMAQRQTQPQRLAQA